MTEQLLHPMEDAADRLGVGLTTIKQLIRDGEIETVRIGRRRLIAATVLEAYVAKLSQVAS